MRILIADDDRVSRTILEATLRQWQHEIEVVADGDAALAALERDDAPEVAILDWEMPGLPGVEVCRRVRARAGARYQFLIVLTAKEARSDLVGALDAGADDYLRKPFDREELRVRLRVAHRILELQRALLQAQAGLRVQATRDALTQCWNRRAILEIVDRELARASRENINVTLALIDLDHFKHINDTYGHAAGDDALRAASDRLARAVRPYDAVGRYGGEEFLVVMPGCEPDGAAEAAERLRLALRAEPVSSAGVEILLTASVGVVCSQVIAGAPAETLIAAADDALYRAKRGGRDRVVVARADDTVRHT